MLKKLLELLFHRLELRYFRERVKSLEDYIKSELRGEKIPLNDFEKKMILDCLVSKSYVEKVSNPETKRFIREIYRNLRPKIVEALKK